MKFSISFYRKFKIIWYKTTRKIKTKKFEINNSIPHQVSLLDLKLPEFYLSSSRPKMGLQFWGVFFQSSLKDTVQMTLLIVYLLGHAFCNRYFRKIFTYKNIPGITCFTRYLEAKHTQNFFTTGFSNDLLAFITKFSFNFFQLTKPDHYVNKKEQPRDRICRELSNSAWKW